MPAAPRVPLLSSAALLLLASAAAGLDSAHTITQYAHTAWRVREGHFASAPTAIAQTRDGFLWLGTQAGLIRFDGVRFMPWQPPPGSRLPSERIISLLGARDGSLWIGTGRGLARWNGSTLTTYAGHGRFGALLEDRRGTIWAGHTRELAELPPLCRFEREKFRCFGFPDQDRLHYVGGLYEDRRGDVWLGGETGVCRLQGERAECRQIEALASLAGKSGVWSIVGDPAGALWAGAGGYGLWRLAAGRWVHYPGPPGLVLDAGFLLADRDGGLWVGVIDGGLLRLVQGRTERFTRADGLSGEEVSALYEDREGSLWVATGSGLDRFRDVRVATLTAREGLPGGYFGAVTAARDGGVWVAERNALLRLDKGGISSYGSAQGLPETGISSVLEDSHGRVWVGLGRGLVWLENGRFFPFHLPDGSDVGVVYSMAEDREGDLWVATVPQGAGLVRIRDGRVVETFAASRLGGHEVRTLAADPGGGLWIVSKTSELRLYRNGVFEPRGGAPGPGLTIHCLLPDVRGLWQATSRGLSLLRDRRLTTLDTRNGLPCNEVSEVHAEGDGSLWLKAACGLIRISSGELASWMEHPERQVQVRWLDAIDGVLPASSPFEPRSARSLDGRLWFAAEDQGVQVLDPGRLAENTIPPPVQILRVLADRKTYSPGPRFELPPLTRDLEIDYTALSLAVPEKVRFRYRLDGSDDAWQEAGTRREALYTNLSPGTYRFRVTACNNDGVWNQEGTALAFAIRPAFYQTRLFLALCIASAAGLAWSAWRFRLRQVQESLDRRFEERLAERMRIAQDLHDTLLQGFLSASMQLHAAVGELPAETSAKPRLERVLQLMRQVIDEGRNALRGLRSAGKEEDDLGQALARTRQELGVPETVGFRIVVEGHPRPLPPMIRDEVYRIGREALVNAFQHSGGTAVEVEIEYGSKALRLLVRDDGTGIDPQVLQAGREGHFGLSGMRERAERMGGRLSVWSRAGAGTEIELTVPGRVAFQNEPAAWTRWWRRLFAPPPP